MPATQEAPLLLSVEAAANAAGVSRSVFYEKLLAGEVASVKIGRRRLVARKSLEEYVERLLEQAAG